MGFLEIMKIVLGLLPVILDAVKSIEAAIPVSGKGKEKMDLIKTALQTTYDATNQTKTTFQVIWPQLESIITKVVSVYNSTGIFKK